MLSLATCTLGFSPTASNDLSAVPALRAFVERAEKEPEAVAAELRASFPAFVATHSYPDYLLLSFMVSTLVRVRQR